MGVIYSVVKFNNFIIMAHSGGFGKKYDQYYLTIYKDTFHSGFRKTLRFYTKKDLMIFFNLFRINLDKEFTEKPLHEYLIKTAHEWGGDKKLKTKRLLSQICEVI